MIDTEFGVLSFIKLLPFIFTLVFSLLAIILSEYLPELILKFKLSILGHSIFGFFNQRFLVEFFYNKYITSLILDLGGQTTKILDKGSIELLGPYGLEKGLVHLSKNINSLSIGIVPNYALYISIGFISYLIMLSNVNINLFILLIILLFIVLFNKNK